MKIFSLNLRFKKLILVVLLAVLAPSIQPAFAVANIEFLNIQVENISGKTVKIKWQTNNDTSGKVIYGQQADQLNNFITDNSGLSRDHQVLIGNLKPETKYYFQLYAADSGEQAVSFIQHFTTSEYHDLVAPLISKIELPYITGTAAVITWETDEPATAVVEYDEFKTYKKIVTSGQKQTSQRLILKNLKPNSRYFLRLYAKDQDNNRSSSYERELATDGNRLAESEDLLINYLRPSGPADSYISANYILIGFRTNHYGKGKVSLLKKGERTRSQELDYGLEHQAVFDGLQPASQYSLQISMQDIFNKRSEVKDYLITTAALQPLAVPGAAAGINIINSDQSACLNSALSQSGYFGQYFNLPADLPNIRLTKIDSVGNATGWYERKYFSFSRLDQQLNFNNFLPLHEGLEGDPYYFSVYWRAILEVPADGDYNYSIASDDDSWLLIDGKLAYNNGGLHTAVSHRQSIFLNQGLHSLEIYYAERKPRHAAISYTMDSSVRIHPWPAGCSFSPDQGQFASGQVAVKGAEYSYYSPASRLVKTADSPDVYAIVNNQRHYISSPASFNQYGYDWSAVETVSVKELEKYPRARLIKSPDGPVIYYLYQRPENKWLKIGLPSPTAFISYSGNYWGNVITVNRLDLGAYPDVKLIKAAGSQEIYYLQNNSKHLVSPAVFTARQFSRPEVAEVSQAHLQTYRTGEKLE